MNKMKRGRPFRGRFEATRIKIWTLAALEEANRREKSVEELLGYDGQWHGMWIRYCRGVVAPSESRLNRIEKVLQGTAQYYRSPIWSLYSPKRFDEDDLERHIDKLAPPFRSRLRWDFEDYQHLPPWLEPIEEELAEVDEDGKFESDIVFYYRELLEEVILKITDPKLGMSALNTLFLMLQEQLLRGNTAGVETLSIAWTMAEELRHRHPLLKHLPIDIFHRALIPLTDLMSWTLKGHGNMSLFKTKQPDTAWESLFEHLSRQPHWLPTAQHHGFVPPPRYLE
ncbi:hypothetical protein [Herbaspirillum huttiense]|uniref:hypothetical protein n=1 Tax=Herbaspirillum huttiense TaxID=863372 RepID=UPI0031DBBF76